MNDKKILKKNANFVSRVIDQETILMPIYKTSHEINAIYTLNPAAAMAWDMFDGKRTVRDVKGRISEVFDATAKEIELQMENLLKDLTDIKALVEK